MLFFVLVKLLLSTSSSPNERGIVIQAYYWAGGSDRRDSSWGTTASRQGPGQETPKMIETSNHDFSEMKNCLVGRLEHFLFFPSIGDNHPNWLSYVSEGFKPPTSCPIPLVSLVVTKQNTRNMHVWGLEFWPILYPVIPRFFFKGGPGEFLKV